MAFPEALSEAMEMRVSELVALAHSAFRSGFPPAVSERIRRPGPANGDPAHAGRFSLPVRMRAVRPLPEPRGQPN